MAVRAAIKDNGKAASTLGDQSIIRVQWNGLLSTSTDTGQPIPFSEYCDAVVHLGVLNIQTGGGSTLGTSDSISMQGSNDYQPSATDDGNPANAGTWIILKDIGNVVVTATALATAFNINERPLWIRPALTAGTGGTWNVVLSAYRRQNMLRGG